MSSGFSSCTLPPRIKQTFQVSNRLRVPIYSIASFSSMVSLEAAQFVDPIRDIYEVRSYAVLL